MISFEEFQRLPDTPERQSHRAAIRGQRLQEEAELAARQSRTAAVYARAEAADSEETGMAIIAAHSRELADEWRARHAA